MLWVRGRWNGEDSTPMVLCHEDTQVGTGEEVVGAHSLCLIHLTGISDADMPILLRSAFVRHDHLPLLLPASPTTYCHLPITSFPSLERSDMTVVVYRCSAGRPIREERSPYIQFRAHRICSS